MRILVIEDEKKVARFIKRGLEEAGYLGETGIPVETGVSSTSENLNSPYFRRANVYEATRKVTSFTQIIGISNRRLWPCPGFGVILSLKQTIWQGEIFTD